MCAKFGLDRGNGCSGGASHSNLRPYNIVVLPIDMANSQGTCDTIREGPH